MFNIVAKKLLAPNIYLMDVEAPRVAKSAKPGQFVIVKLNEKGERIPLTICDDDAAKGTVTIVFQVVGQSTHKMALLEVGDRFMDFVGPLGHPSEFFFQEASELQGKNLLFVAGGVGTAPVYPQVKWLWENGVKVDVLIGSRNKEMLILKDEMAKVSRNLYIATDDGSEGFKGLVTEKILELVEKENKQYDEVIAIGPMIMMKFVAALTKKLGIKTIVSLNTLMVDGTGMCGACRVRIGDETKFTCVDGPEFDGHLVDFDEAIRRQSMYKSVEGLKMLEEQQKNHKCQLDSQADNLKND